MQAVSGCFKRCDEGLSNSTCERMASPPGAITAPSARGSAKQVLFGAGNTADDSDVAHAAASGLDREKRGKKGATDR